MKYLTEKTETIQYVQALIGDILSPVEIGNAKTSQAFCDEKDLRRLVIMDVFVSYFNLISIYHFKTRLKNLGLD